MILFGSLGKCLRLRHFALDYSALVYGTEKIRYHIHQLAHALVGMPELRETGGKDASMRMKRIIQNHSSLRQPGMRIFHSPPILSRITTFVQIPHLWEKNNGLQQIASKFSKGGQI
jgi:hypothetical protein